MGLYRMCGDIGLLFGPVSVGWAAEHLGFNLTFVAVAGGTALVALMGIRSRETLVSHEAGLEAGPTLEEPAQAVGSRQ
jgi:hypothetical protein